MFVAGAAVTEDGGVGAAGPFEGVGGPAAFTAAAGPRREPYRGTVGKGRTSGPGAASGTVKLISVASPAATETVRV